jgi:two-component system LytT family sensor kinase
VRITNNGLGLYPETPREPAGPGGVGLSNVTSRLKLHYGPAHQFSIAEPEKNIVAVTLTLPLQFSASPTQTVTGYGV